jgi:site-specific DNA recombinase
MDCILYARVSTSGQAEDGVSLDMQKTRAAGFCAANGYRLAHVFVEVQSGGRADNRPELQRALDTVCRAKGVLVVYSLSRLARSVRDTIDIAERIDRAGAHLASITEKIDTTSAAGRMFFHLISAFAEFERATLSERTESAMGHMRRAGRRISGRVPYGSELSADGVTLKPVATEQANIQQMRAWRAAGSSYAEIALRLTSAAVPCKAGGTVWAPATVLFILRRQAKLAA